MHRKLRWARFLMILLAIASAGCVPEFVEDGLTTGVTDGINDIVVALLTSLVSS